MSFSFNSINAPFPFSPNIGGTGIDNGINTITLGGNFSTGGVFSTGGDFSTEGSLAITGNYAITFIFSDITNATFPIGTYTLATVDETISSIVGTTNQIDANTVATVTTLSFPSVLYTANSTVLDDGSSNMEVGNDLIVTNTVTIEATTNQLVLGTANTTTISSVAPSASRTYTIQDAGAATNFVLCNSTNTQILIGPPLYESNTNVLIGIGAGTSNITSETSIQHVVIGAGAGSALNSSSLDTVLIGYHSGQQGTPITTGTQITLVGSKTAVNSASAINRTAIGYNVSGNIDNQVVLGNTSVTSLINSSQFGGCSLGTQANPFGFLVVGTSSVNNVTIAPASQAAARSYTIPDIGTNGNFSVTANVDVTSGSQTMAPGSRYWADKVTLTTFTLPTTPTQGDRYEIYGIGSGGWTLVENSGQFINMGNQVTTTTTGSLSSTNQYDALIIIAFSTTQFVAYPLIGNITVV